MRGLDGEELSCKMPKPALPGWLNSHVHHGIAAAYRDSD